MKRETILAVGITVACSVACPFGCKSEYELFLRNEFPRFNRCELDDKCVIAQQPGGCQCDLAVNMDLAAEYLQAIDGLECAADGRLGRVVDCLGPIHIYRPICQENKCILVPAGDCCIDGIVYDGAIPRDPAETCSITDDHPLCGWPRYPDDFYCDQEPDHVCGTPNPPF